MSDSDLVPAVEKLVLQLEHSSRLEFLYKAVEDTQNTIRFIDTKAAFFVTLLSGGEEVACIGRVVSDDPLLTAVASTAAALVEDPKAKALSREQWDAASVEISILGGLHPVKDLLDVRAGVDGLVLQTDGREAVILPSEADEGPSSSEALLAKLAEKAGLPQEKWGKDSVKSFTTQEVREDSGHPDAGSR